MNKDRKSTTQVAGRASQSMSAANVIASISRAWIAACTAARHRGTDVPSRTRRSVQDFKDEHMPRCFALRTPQEMP